MNNEDAKFTEDFLKAQEEFNVAHSHFGGKCPHCGYCPHCGRGGHYIDPRWPYYPTPWPNYPPVFPLVTWGENSPQSGDNVFTAIKAGDIIP
jgi:hypothetical protein